MYLGFIFYIERQGDGRVVRERETNYKYNWGRHHARNYFILFIYICLRVFLNVLNI